MGVAVLRPAPADGGFLATRRLRQPVGAQDSVEQSVLQHRVRAGGQVIEQRCHQASARVPGTGVEALGEARRRRPPGAHQLAQQGDRVVVGRRAIGSDHGRGLEVHPRWRSVPRHVVVELAHPADPDAPTRSDPARPVDGHLDRLARQRRWVGQGVPAGQRGRLGVQDRGPAALRVAQRAGVVDVHAGVHRRQRASAQQGLDLRLGQPGRTQLASVDHPVLGAQERAEVERQVHGCSMPRRGRDTPTAARLWTDVIGECWLALGELGLPGVSRCG